jgi:hypothetical protein
MVQTVQVALMVRMVQTVQVELMVRMVQTVQVVLMVQIVQTVQVMNHKAHQKAIMVHQEAGLLQQQMMLLIIKEDLLFMMMSEVHAVMYPVQLVQCQMKQTLNQVSR